MRKVVGLRKVWCGDSGSSYSEATARLTLLLEEAHGAKKFREGDNLSGKLKGLGALVIQGARRVIGKCSRALDHGSSPGLALGVQRYLAVSIM